ncbi:acetate/propionate family kinase [Pseudonocardia zijingensis]|uniref:Acetate kinase n=1 Tax=Pseudonocardia zijingensis TaxID=153376 RepID=A0ABP3ZHY0_9PSEU
MHAAAAVERWEGCTHLGPLRRFLDEAGEIGALGHRVVHGGARYRAPARVDDDLLAYLGSIQDLAPLHNPRAVAGIRALQELLPGVPAVACFDTAFHATLPAEASTYALPREWNARWGLRRYGFHGLSHSYATARAAEIVGAALPDLRVVSCHLGAGASLAAVRDGVSLDTTMGFTPLAGLVMVTRSGDVDPGLLMWLLRYGGVEPHELNAALKNRSGLKGLSGTSGDLRDVLAGRAEGDPDCALAFDVFVHHLCREVAGMTAAARGLDLLVMTGGVGEHAPLVRARVASRLAYLGVRVDAGVNERTTADGDISAADAPVRTVVVTTREDLEIARRTAALLAADHAPARRLTRAATGGVPPGSPAGHGSEDVTAPLRLHVVPLVLPPPGVHETDRPAHPQPRRDQQRAAGTQHPERGDEAADRGVQGAARAGRHLARGVDPHIDLRTRRRRPLDQHGSRVLAAVAIDPARRHPFRHPLTDLAERHRRVLEQHGAHLRPRRLLQFGLLGLVAVRGELRHPGDHDQQQCHHRQDPGDHVLDPVRTTPGRPARRGRSHPGARARRRRVQRSRARGRRVSARKPRCQEARVLPVRDHRRWPRWRPRGDRRRRTGAHRVPDDPLSQLRVVGRAPTARRPIERTVERARARAPGKER